MRKRLQRKGARRGFTLVELLIVIIIIGILAGAMMLVAGTSRDAAEASKIISDIRNVKAAALMWIAENPAQLTDEDWTDLGEDPTPLNRYLDKPLIEGQDIFIFEVGKVKASEDDDGTDTWLLGYDLGAANARDGVKKNLAKQAQSAGLFGSNQIQMYAPNYYNEGTEAYVIVQ